jgi:hypothetical protein
MTSPIRTLILMSTLALIAPLSAANDDGLQVHVESVSLVPMLLPDELARALAEIESQYVSYSGFVIIPLRDRAPSLNPSDRAAVETFERDLQAAIQNFDGREYQPYNSPQQYADLVNEMEVLLDDGRASLDQALIAELQRIESSYSGISGFALIGLAQEGQALIDGSTPSARDSTAPKGGFAGEAGRATEDPEIDEADERAFWASYNEALEGYSRQVVAESEEPENPFAEMTVALQEVHDRFFSGSGSNDQLTVTLVIENHSQRPATIRQRARMRILGDSNIDVSLSTMGSTTLQGYEVSTISFTSEPLADMDTRVASDIRIAVRDDAGAVVAVQDAGGQALTARTRLGSGDAGMSDEQLEDALDAALGGG